MSESAKPGAKKGDKKSDKKESFWKGVKTEYRKVTWPDRTETFKQSVAVLCVSVVLGLVITFLDTLVQFGINFLTNIG